MNTPPQLKPAIWGALGGAIVLAVIGFAWGGWVTAGSAAAMVKTGSERAVMVAYTPICVSQFNTQPDAAAKLVELKALGQVRTQAQFVADGGWATMPGSDKPAVGLDRACLTALLAT